MAFHLCGLGSNQGQVMYTSSAVVHLLRLHRFPLAVIQLTAPHPSSIMCGRYSSRNTGPHHVDSASFHLTLTRQGAYVNVTQ
jgi:hypothetical protein